MHNSVSFKIQVLKCKQYEDTCISTVNSGNKRKCACIDKIVWYNLGEVWFDLTIIHLLVETKEDLVAVVNE